MCCSSKFNLIRCITTPKRKLSFIMAAAAGARRNGNLRNNVVIDLDRSTIFAPFSSDIEIERFPGRNVSQSFPDNWEKNKLLWEQMDGANRLQCAQNTSLGPECLSGPIQFLLRSLPPAVAKEISITIFEEEFRQPQPAFENYIATLNADTRNRLTRRMRRKEYHFWFINANTQENPHWMLVIFHLQQTAGRQYDMLESIAIVDPQRNAESVQRNQRIAARMQDYFGIANINNTGIATTRFWTPPMNPINYPVETHESYSSGLRCFDTVRQLVYRISEFYCKQTAYSERKFWADTHGWFNPNSVRKVLLYSITFMKSY